MNQPTRLTRALAGIALAAVALASTACGPEEQALWDAHMANSSRVAQLVSTRSPGGPSDAMLANLRNCESHGNYTVVSRTGTYRGAYQFSRSTWDRVAARVLPEYKGVDPIVAPTYVQDAMARALWSQTGWSSWPVCGRRV